jgi:squalene-hopene/tetraprenyl-beta-curcumene cyclase
VNQDSAQPLRRALRGATSELLAELGPSGHWIGELSSSALATATAVTALATVDATTHAGLIRPGLDWLARHVNNDGGWGDTEHSRSNVSTTALVWAAFGAARADPEFTSIVAGAAGYLRRNAGPLDQLVPAIEKLYGQDRTFSVPITMTLALSGRLGPDGWRQVRPLPFELAALPRAVFAAMGLPVVSYALPALIAIGQVIHHHAPRWNPIRRLVGRPTLDRLTRLQPANGGFLEATPLTSFVTMSLAAMELSAHPVARRGVEFLRTSARPDGSWPIDTNLATWVTTLAVKALRYQPGILSQSQRAVLRAWLLGQQHQLPHSYTGAAPGGWAWTDLPGGVPDADDTAGALLALRELGGPDPELRPAGIAGVQWLLDLQNRDGGMPTFCRGWGRLPFDRGTPEITAHAARAWRAWMSDLPLNLAERTRAALNRASRFLSASQREDGAWIPLWFGNEHAPHDQNPVYGTAQVLFGLGATVHLDGIRQRGWHFLQQQQNPDAGWGGALNTPSTVEETALAIEALSDDPSSANPVARGAHWLIQRMEHNSSMQPAPIGLYFARLWYAERLYPLVFAVAALGKLDSKNG